MTTFTRGGPEATSAGWFTRLSVLAWALVVCVLPSRRAWAESSGTLPTAINLPSGPGSIEGFGQGYDVSPSSGLPSLSYPISLPPARAGFGPELALRYAAGHGQGVVGLGWSIGLPRLERSTKRGIPSYGELVGASPSRRGVSSGGDSLVLRGLGSSEEIVYVEGANGSPGVFRERIEGASPIFVVPSGEGFEARTTSDVT